MERNAEKCVSTRGLKQITERNAEKCASTRGFETDNGAECRKMCVRGN